MVFFVLCLLGLGLSFFFGLMTGLSGRPAESAPSREAAPAPGAREGPPDTATTALESRLASQAPRETPSPAAEPTAPAVLQAFEDSAAGEPTPSSAPSRRAAAAPMRAASGVFIQVASLSSRGEADALSGRLSRHGYRARIAEAQTPKGRVFRVRVGPYPSEEEAARAAEGLRRREKIRQTWLVREGR